MIIFSIYTQYHLFNCMNIKMALHQSEKAIAFIMRPDDSGLRQYYSKLLQNGIFVQIYEFNPDWINDTNTFSKLTSIPRITKSSKESLKFIRSLSFGERVECVYTYECSIELCMLFDHIQKTNNSAVKLVCYEEGAGSYCRPTFNQMGRISRAITKRLGISVPEPFSKQLLYQPMCLTVQQTCELEPMPQFNREFAPIFNDVFSFIDKGDYPKAVFFNGPDRKLDLFLADCIDGMDLAHTTTKSHPRASLGTQLTSKRFPYNDPWEVLCANRPTQNKVFVSHFSTAMYTPKSIFGDEPYLVFLFGLSEAAAYDDAVISPMLMSYFKRFLSTYEHPERIMVPTSISELKQVLISHGA